ncbi:MAG: DUF5615 family PIN-like protein [Hormoscilla sp. GM7CHS1pb]|nr:DUF5615 family PIN-like protein [Hormoscilla sp. GM7CHS1pb]
MARLYADEQYPLPIVELLRAMGHDALTVQSAGNAGLPDEEVLAFAMKENRAFLTMNRRYFRRLHGLQSDQAGIIVCTQDQDWERQAQMVNEAIDTAETLAGQLIRVYKSPPSTSSS